MALSKHKLCWEESAVEHLSCCLRRQTFSTTFSALQPLRSLPLLPSVSPPRFLPSPEFPTTSGTFNRHQSLLLPSGLPAISRASPCLRSLRPPSDLRPLYLHASMPPYLPTHPPDLYASSTHGHTSTSTIKREGRRSLGTAVEGGNWSWRSMTGRRCFVPVLNHKTIRSPCNFNINVFSSRIAHARPFATWWHRTS